MSDRAHLLAAIAAHYHEDTPRLEYADWLQEHGETDLDRATEEFIRVSCDMHNSPYMPKDAYQWIEDNWRRLVPSVIALTAPIGGATGIYAWHREGRTIYVRLNLTYPLSRAKSGRRECPMRPDFHRGLLRKVLMWSSFAAGKTGEAFFADQPSALLDCAGTVFTSRLTFSEIFADEKLREALEAYTRFGRPTEPSLYDEVSA